MAKAGVRVILAVCNTELGRRRAAEIGGSTAGAQLHLPDPGMGRGFPGLVRGDVDVLTNNAGVVAQHRNPILR